jgi:5-dehydro-4-deoxyglucarate dehydratase
MATELRIGDGVLFFPVTPFDEHDRVARGLLERHIGQGVAHAPAAVFAACGTGEFHALSLDDYRDAVAGGVSATAGAAPVIAGVGGPLGHARDCARAAEQLGADGLLVMPPYLVAGPQRGLRDYVRAVAAVTALPLIVYHRGAAPFTVDSMQQLLELPAVVGIKDGVGDISLIQLFVRAAAAQGRSDLLFFNGLLTAELSQAAYRAIGVPMYSSAVFAMAPEIATAFYRAYAADDKPMTDALLDGFYAPLVALRDESPGFAVALIKAGVRLGGLAVGPVRPPLVDPDADQLARLANLLETGRGLVA